MKTPCTRMSGIFAAATALLAGHSAQAQAPQWYCSAQAFAADAGAVAVQIYVHRDGFMVGHAILWSPPAIRRESMPPYGDNALDLSIDASQGSAAALAAPDTVSVSVETNEAIFPKEHLSIEANGAKADAAFDQFGAMQLPALPSAPSLWIHTASIGPDADNAALLAALATAPRMTANLVADDGRVVASAVFDLRGRREAIRIAGQAWREAQQRRRSPLARCDKTE